MSWLLYIAVAWLVLAVVTLPVLYVGYGFVMAAKRANDAGLSPSHRWMLL